jgi:hypothetical protein
MDFSTAKKAAKAAYLKNKFKQRSYCSTWNNLRAAVYPLTYLLQIITAALAVACPAYCVFVLSGSWLAGFLIGGLLICCFEYFKRHIVNNAVLSYFKRFALSTYSILILLAVTSVSVAFSCIGTPIIVSEFSPKVKQAEKSAVIAPFLDQEKQAAKYWQGVKKDAEQKAAQVFSQNNWRGVIVKAARKEKLAFDMQAKAAQDSLNNALAAIQAGKEKELSKQAALYAEQSTKQTKELQSIGFILAFVTLGFELLFILCFVWLNYFDYRQALELGLITLQSFKSTPESTAKAIQVPKVEQEAQQRGGIGFNSEGKILNDGGRLKILCKTRAGLKAYDSAYLSTLCSGTKGQPKNKYWQDMRQKLEAAKQA